MRQSRRRLLKSILLSTGLSLFCTMYLISYRDTEMELITDVINTLEVLDQETRPGYLKFRGEWINTNYPDVLDIIRKLTVGPSKEPYNLTSKNNYTAFEFLKTQRHEPWLDVVILIETLLPKGQQRYFLECGANNGEMFSNTLYLERYLNWTGLLIEADPIYFKDMTAKHRRAVQVEACAGPNNTASLMTLHHSPYSYQARSKTGENVTIYNPGRGYLVGFNYQNITDEANWSYMDVLCLPMYQIMLASNMTSFDFVVLDAEGVELSILETIPFDKVDMKFIMVEMVNEDYQDKVVALMKKNKYTLHSFFAGNAHPTNGLFIRNDVYDREKLEKELSISEIYQMYVGDKSANELSPEEQMELMFIFEVSSENRNLTRRFSSLKSS